MFLVYLFISVSLIFFSLSVLGLFRFPDVYTRLHSAGLSTTFGFLFFTLTSLIYFLIVENFNFSLPARMIIIALILLIIQPCIGHAISRAAYRNGVKPKEAIIDKLNNRTKTV